MSTIAVNAITDANGGSTTSINGTTPNAYNTVGKNLIINGAMQISQRGTSWSHAHDGTQWFYTIDRYEPYLRTTHSTLDGTWSQSTDAPDGFSNSLLWTTGTAESSINADDFFYVRTKLEGQTLQQLAYGTSSAKVSTISFWIKSSVAGTYGFSMYNQDSNRQVAIPYTINSANTWEKKTITIPADTTGSIDNDNNASLNFYWFIDAGSDFTTTSQSTWTTYSNSAFAGGHSQNGVATTSSATFAITGIQLEVGESATEFEHRPYGIELQLCQRYYWATQGGNGTFPLHQVYGLNGSHTGIPIMFPVTMRTIPTGAVNGTWQLSNCTGPIVSYLGMDGCTMRILPTATAGCYAYPNGDDDKLTFDSEL